MKNQITNWYDWLEFHKEFLNFDDENIKKIILKSYKDRNIRKYLIETEPNPEYKGLFPTEYYLMKTNRAWLICHIKKIGTFEEVRKLLNMKKIPI